MAMLTWAKDVFFTLSAIPTSPFLILSPIKSLRSPKCFTTQKQNLQKLRLAAKVFPV